MSASKTPLKIAISLGIIIAAGAFYWFSLDPTIIHTENAYVKADKFPLSSEVNAPITSVLVEQNQAIKKGDLLLTLDDTALQYAVQEAESSLQQVKNELIALQGEYKEAAEELMIAKQDVTFYQRQVERNQKLDSVGVSEATLDEARQMLIRAKSKIRLTEQKLNRLLAELGGNIEQSIEQHARVKMAQATLERTNYKLSQSKLFAPVDGFIANQVPHEGQMVFPGMALVTIIGSETLWIEANLKETQLTNIAIGQQAEVTVDAYPDIVWQAQVESLSPASGSEFALIPAQNASGNWVKVVQRLPVRLKLDLSNRSLPTLRAGMSSEVRIKTK